MPLDASHAGHGEKANRSAGVGIFTKLRPDISGGKM